MQAVQIHGLMAGELVVTMTACAIQISRPQEYTHIRISVSQLVQRPELKGIARIFIVKCRILLYCYLLRGSPHFLFPCISFLHLTMLPNFLQLDFFLFVNYFLQRNCSFEICCHLWQNQKETEQEKNGGIEEFSC